MAVTEILWPANLPQTPVVRKGNFIKFGMPQNTAITTKPSAGKVLTRPRSSAFYRPVDIPLVVKSYEEVDAFYHFFMVTLASGTQPFKWPGWVRTGPDIFQFDLNADPPDPKPLGEGVHEIPMHLLQFPAGAT